MVIYLDAIQLRPSVDVYIVNISTRVIGCSKLDLHNTSCNSINFPVFDWLKPANSWRRARIAIQVYLIDTLSKRLGLLLR